MVMETKKRKALITFVCLIFALVAVFLGLILGKEIKNMTDTATLNNTVIEGYTYTLRANATEVQKEYFKELREALDENDPGNIDEVKAVAKCFIADFYTWTNKNGNYDIGGYLFYYEPKRNSFALCSKNYFYRNMYYVAQEYGKENLPQVKEVIIDESTLEKNKSTTEIKGETYPVYLIKADIVYEDSTYDTSSLQQYTYVYVITGYENECRVISVYGDW